jgi:integrase
LHLPKRRKVPLTLAGATPLYLDRLREEGGKEIDRKRQRLQQCLLPFLGELGIDKITSFDIERYKKHRLSQHVQTRKKVVLGQTLPLNKPATVNRELATLSHLLNKAVEWGWIERQPAKIRKLKEDNGRIVYLSPAQAAALLESAKSDQTRQIYPFILIGLRTGMRKSEILSIRRAHVDLDARSIYIPAAKAGARSQPISADLASFLVDYIDTLPKGTPWLFPSVGASQGHTVDVRKAFVRAVTAAALDPTVKRISGHKTMAMVERDAHQSGSHIAEGMDKLDDRYRPKKGREALPDDPLTQELHTGTRGSNDDEIQEPGIC